MSASRPSAGARPGALQLIEEAVHLLRRAPAGALALYYAGSASFVLGLLFFWAYMTWFTPPPATMAWGACGLVLLFTAMKAAHAEFCSRLMALRLGAAPAPLSWARLRRLAGGQLRIQAWGLFVLPLCLLAIVPFGWAYAYYQSASVLGDSEDAHGVAMEQATLWPGQNVLGLLLLCVLWMSAWLNLAAAFWFLPWFANRVLGIDNLFGFSGWWKYNTTFIASVFGLAWLVTDPLVKAFYTLRVFYGRARSTGEDLRVELEASAAPAGRRIAVALLLLLVACAAAPGALAAEAPRAAAAVSPAKLDASIDEVLAGRDFQWRLRQPASEADDEKDGPLKRFVRSGVEMIKAIARDIGRLWRRISDWFRGLFPRGEAVPESHAASAGSSWLQVLLYVFAGLAVVLLAVVVGLAMKSATAERRSGVKATALEPAKPDLADEGSHAGQLSTDGWLDLAREQLALGEWRLVWRALYLATLARLAAQGLVSLAKFKTNLDYEREVGRRALGRQDVFARFAARRGSFEAVWYGNMSPDESKARDWLAEMERRGTP